MGKKDYFDMAKTTKKETNDMLKDVLVFDCETTGTVEKGKKWDVDFAEFPKVVQLAWSFNEKERSYIIKPDGWVIPEEATAIHGIINEMANKEGVSFELIIDEFLNDCAAARLLAGHNIYFDTSIIKAMILYVIGREYYDAKADDALYKGKRIDTMMKTIKFVGALFKNGRPGKFPTLEELYNKCFPGETFPAHDAMQDVRACKRCIPVLVEKGIIELKPKEYPAEQLKLTPEQEPAKTKMVKRAIEFHDPNPVLTPVVEPEQESKVKQMLDENEF